MLNLPYILLLVQVKSDLQGGKSLILKSYLDHSPTRDFVEGYKYSYRGAKMKTPHLIPLSNQALAIIKEVYKYSGHTQNVFPKTAIRMVL